MGREQEDIDTIHEHSTLSKMKKILNTRLIPCILFMFNSESRTAEDLDCQELAQRHMRSNILVE